MATIPFLNMVRKQRRNSLVILNRVLKRKASYDGVTIIASSYNPDLFKMSTSVSIKIDRGRITQVRSLGHKSK